MGRSKTTQGRRARRAGARLGAVWAVVWLAGACGQRSEDAVAPAAPTVVSLGPENVVRVEPMKLESGPVISGSLQARRLASVRAEMGGSILDVNAEQGQAVKEGEVLARVEERTLREQVLAASSTLRVARNALQVAKADEQRNQVLVKQGVITRRDFERTQLARTQAEGQLAEAQARLKLAQDQLARTKVTAPFNGVVSERQVNAGDIVQPGAPLFTVVDPATLRLEASVPAAQLGQVKVGTPVDFQVNGYADRAFKGEVERINPAVDPATGQVRIYVSIPNSEQTLLSGLFALGRVASQAKEALAVPVDALDTRQEPPTVQRISNGKVEQVAVTTGLRDDVAQTVEVRQGLKAGDVVLLGSARDLTHGTPVKLTAAPEGPKKQRPATPPEAQQGVGGAGSASGGSGPMQAPVPAPAAAGAPTQPAQQAPAK
ncbi:efflux RND transporter periplasmic adaptor subunit [Corallococcus aberystwythensis]|uniref:Efflux RND transporter periplasmic adaptor subunit n=1 Tax=Corallococcus aberystwythensis TaxID=2316722 RepID=A0A3A8Q9Y2_9BACT|nr:efflux RND transporter periplasmic adaptor subunit [Corallococcus aberystwythensis]RKH65416.1 efflux RND transporter periplasmic adaptor subunit [Corallococcus aberystwythensis]